MDNEKIYDEKIAPLMGQIVAICREHEIPVFAQFILKRDEEADIDYPCTTCWSFDNEYIRRLYAKITGGQ